MSQEITLETMYELGPFLIFGAVMSSLVPALVMKGLMSRLFDEKVSFLLLLVVSVFTVLLSMAAVIWLGLFDRMANDTMPLGPTVLLLLASYVLQLAMLTMFVTNSDLEIIAMWKWIVVLIAQMVLYLLFSLILGLAFGLITATV